MKILAILVLALLAGCTSTREIKVTAESEIPVSLEVNSIVKCEKTPCEFSVACTHKKKVFGATHYLPATYRIEANALTSVKGYVQKETKIIDACQIGEEDVGKIRFFMRESGELPVTQTESVPTLSPAEAKPSGFKKFLNFVQVGATLGAARANSNVNCTSSRLGNSVYTSCR